MVVTRSVTRKKNQDECNRKRAKALKDIDTSPWSNLMDEILFLILLRLGVADFTSFSGVCKRWRSIARSGWNMFMATRLPMSLSFSTVAYKKHCYLEDINKSRKYKINIPHSMGRTCVGVTRGYLILFGMKAYDFWLVNPLTRHELHFPRVTCFPINDPANIKGVLGFSPSMSGLVFLVSQKPFNILWFRLAGKEARWNRLFFRFPIHDIHAFQGKIYTLNEGGFVFEVRFNPKPYLTTVLTINPMKWDLLPPKLANWGGRLYVLASVSEGGYAASSVDFDEKKGGYSTKKIEKYAFFVNALKSGGVGKVGIWMEPHEEYKRFGYFHGIVNHTGKLLNANMWYFPHDCLDVKRLLE